MKRKNFALILSFFIILTIPTINAVTIDNSQQKQAEKQEVGTIYGWTGYCHWPGYSSVPFVRVWIGCKHTISDLTGDFKIRGLPINEEYTIFYTRWDYVIKSEKYFLDQVMPDREIDLMFNENDKKTSIENTMISNKKERCETNFIDQENAQDIFNSNIFGSVSGSVFVHCFPPPVHVIGAKLSLETDFMTWITFSGIMGKFRFNAVPVGRQYTLTMTHPKYRTVSETFTLFPDEPNLRIGIGTSEKDDALEKNIFKGLNYF